MGDSSQAGTPADLPPCRPAAAGVVAVVVTHNRPHLLDKCLNALHGQALAPGGIIVIDNASGPETAAVLRRHAGVHAVRIIRNTGGAGGFWAGIALALSRGGEWLWLMDDDGRPARPDCLSRLLAAADAHAADMVGALVIDVDRPDRLAFPMRIEGRTIFDVATVVRHGLLHGFAHLFNGVLVHARLFRRVGLPDPRFLIRGDEVEFLFRARRARARIVLEPGAAFLHPGSMPEIHPILGGRFYAVVPDTAIKRYLQFRNRGYIFRRYGMWSWLAADVIRYGCHFLGQRDIRGFAAWMDATLCGIRGGFMRVRR